jgi:hypothetical protein
MVKGETCAPWSHSAVLVHNAIEFRTEFVCETCLMTLAWIRDEALEDHSGALFAWLRQLRAQGTPWLNARAEIEDDTDN